MQGGQPGRNPNHVEPIHPEVDADVQSHKDCGRIIPVLWRPTICRHITQPSDEHTKQRVRGSKGAC